MIKNIVIHSVATYSRLGVTLNDLQKVNIIYGGNGTGKTTLSRMLAGYDCSTPNPHFQMDWDGAPLQILVYNEDYKSRCLNENPQPSTHSEGEATMLAFQNFMDRVEETPGAKVVVIDDPISSLDYAAIDLVSSLTNDLIKRARKSNDSVRQIIVLTHNSSYLKRLCINPPRKNTCYWTLYKNRDVTKAAAFGKENPVHGYYEELWAKLRDKTNHNPKEKLHLMRRIIETYFLQYGGMNRQELFSGVQSSLARYFNTCSPKAITVRKNIKEDSLEQAFRQFFEKTGQIEHYNMMMGF